MKVNYRGVTIEIPEDGHVHVYITCAERIDIQFREIKKPIPLKLEKKEDSS